MEILNTNRLILRTMNENDIEPLYRIVFNDVDVTKHTFGSSNFTFEECVKFLKENGNFSNKLGLSVLVEKSTNKIIGLAGVLECEYLSNKDYEIGFILERNSWGKGYAKEIGLAQCKQIKDDLKQKRALAVAHKDNLSSIKCLEKLGFEYIKSVEAKRGEREVFSLEF